MSTSYMRYYDSDASGEGFEHGLRHAVSGDNYDKLMSLGGSSPLTDPDGASDAEVAERADVSFRYKGTGAAKQTVEKLWVRRSR